MSYVLGSSSQRHLQGVHPALVKVVRLAIQLTNQDFTVQEGLRSVEQQTKNVAKGVSKTMNSKHLPQADGLGHAVDLVPWEDGRARWEWPLIYPVATAMFRASQTLGTRLRWGGVWDRAMSEYGGDPEKMKDAVANYCTRHPGPDFIDGPHYELL